MLFSSAFAITEMRDMDMYEVCWSVFVGFWDRDYVSQLPYVWYYVGVKSSFQHAREDCETKRACCLVCQDLVICYFYFVLLPLGHWMW